MGSNRPSQGEDFTVENGNGLLSTDVSTDWHVLQSTECTRCRDEGSGGPPGRCDLGCVRFVDQCARDVKMTLGKLVTCSHCELIVILFVVDWELWVICLF